MIAIATSDQFWPVSKDELFDQSYACIEHQGKIDLLQTT